MERLQEALSRARVRREDASGSAASPAVKKPIAAAKAPHVPDQPLPQDSDIAAAWRALPQFMPNENLLKKNRLVSFFGGQTAAPFDMMRTKIIQQAKANNWRRIVITSPTPRCGKTTVAANLAFTLARQTDLRTLVIESDMRRPKLAGLLGITDSTAFARALAGLDEPEAHMVAYGTNLAFATNQQSAANSAEILQNQTAQDVLAKLEDKYAPDIVLFDAAPMLSSDDTVGLLEYTDAALIIAAADTSTIEEVDLVESEVAAITNVMGVVLNKTRSKPSSYGYNDDYY